MTLLHSAIVYRSIGSAEEEEGRRSLEVVAAVAVVGLVDPLCAGSPAVSGYPELFQLRFLLLKQSQQSRLLS